jgi:hypothetical protein
VGTQESKGAEMTPTETAAILRQFNEWRRGDEDIPQFDPRKIGAAIDAEVEMIERMERQKPVATVRINAINGNPSVDFVPGHHYLHHNDKLYLAPSAQPAHIIQEGWKLVPIEPTHEMLDAGEDTFFPTYTGTPVSAPIDVYRAMLAAAPEAKP